MDDIFASGIEEPRRDPSASRIELLPALPKSCLSAADVAHWVERQQLPEGLRRRGLESLARALLTTQWWHVVDDLREGIRCSQHEQCRLIQLGRVFHYYVYGESGVVDFCHIDPNCGPRWCTIDVMRPVQLRFWVRRVLHQQHRLQSAFEATLVEHGWKHYPDPDRSFDFEAASQVAISVWEWIESVIHRRLHHAGLGRLLNQKLRSLMNLDPSLLAIALRARPSFPGRACLPCGCWNLIAKHRAYFVPLMQHLPSAVPALATLMQGQDIEQSRPIAEMLVRSAYEAAGALTLPDAANRRRKR